MLRVLMEQKGVPKFLTDCSFNRKPIKISWYLKSVTYLRFVPLSSGLLPESQCRERDARRKVKRRFHPKKHSTSPLPKTDSPAADVCENPLELLKAEERRVVEKLVAYQDQYDVPSEEAISTLSLGMVAHL